MKELKPEELYWHCDPKCITDVTPEFKIVGQDRAVQALRLGLDIDAPGYNIYVSGPVGTGRKTITRRLLKETKRAKRIPDDKCYVNNFANPDMPILIRLPAGSGRKFQRDMDNLIDYFIERIPAAFESQEYLDKRKEMIESYKKKEQAIIEAFQNRVKENGFAIVQVQVGPFAKPELFPVISGEPVNFNQIDKLIEEGRMRPEDRERLKEIYEKLSEEMEETFRKTRKIEQEAAEKLKELDTTLIKPLIEHRVDELIERYKIPRVTDYLKEVKRHLLENIEVFKKKEKVESAVEEIHRPYRINLVVDNAETKEGPVIYETSPTYRNLFGTIERMMIQPGQWRSDYTMIKTGSLVAADGGFLILDVRDVLLEPGVWPALKRALKNKKVEIQAFDPFYLLTTSGLKPEPIEIDVKVVLIGEPYLYYLLYQFDPDFRKIFKLRADFNEVMDVSEDAINEYASLISRICEEEKTLTPTMGAIARIVEFGMREAGRKTKLTTRFDLIADVLREANFWAEKAKSNEIAVEHVNRAIEERIERSRLIEEKIQEMIEEGLILIDTEGKVVGQVNGLSVIDMGDYMFGRPSRITAKVSVGSSGIIDIEREAELSGRIHSKGVLILSGFLRERYAQDKPLAVSASICFEQSYSGVEGDSASSAELYCLLSALSGVPLRQDLAVTGSVNQKGEIQPIGGVNQKIEGFFAVCKAKGLTGTQGVIIPKQNIGDLMLKKEVVDAVREGKFHIYAIETIDEGIELLTGMKAGELEDGKYPEGTINYLVDKRLKEYAQHWRNYREPFPTSRR
ncbi:ATP-dependent protease [candidate division WOR-3 bacterium]|uniref:endopeptidase La n=1 Tax=candidate division WOR-3 bacterium TaxID=2052148 RepID=A0A660SHH2_UNCW3|nr:MAG: ATP-dependent protease [candidate division WOR-3 bacterium]